MDGTIFDSKIDLGAIRRDLGLPRDGRGILEQISELPTEARARGMAALLDAEAQSAASGELIPGAAEILATLRSRGVLCVLVTNNSRASVDAMFARFPLPFDLSLSRDDGPTKPSPALFLTALAQCGAAPHEAISLGDAHLDLIAAHAAGVAEIVLVSPQPWVLDFVPASIPHRRAADLYEAEKMVESLLDLSSGD
jgi:HAD superfamily hydrolase (TIGR01549 family)